MNKDKWREIYKIELTETNEILGSKLPTPETWEFYKEVIINLIEEMDKATEVYNMENKK